MPAKIRPSDWDRYFSSKYRSSGPLMTFMKSLVVVAILGGLGYGGAFLKNALDERNASQAKLAVARQATATARARENALQATTQAQPTTAPLQQGRVFQQTALLADPENSGSVQGEIFANSNVAFLEARDVNGQRWWKVRVIDQANPSSAAPNSEGWIIAGTVSEPEQVPVAQQTPVTAELPPVSMSAGSLELKRDQSTNISMSGISSWQPQGFPSTQLSFYLAPSAESGEGILAAKVLNFPQDQEGLEGASYELAAALAKPETIPQLNIAGNDGTTLTGNVIFVRSINGQDYTLQGRVLAKPAPGNSIGVVIAFVPQNSYAANESILTQMVQGAIFQ